MKIHAQRTSVLYSNVATYSVATCLIHSVATQFANIAMCTVT